MPVNKDHTKFLIQRYDAYYSSVNTKGAFMLAFNTFLAGAMVTSYKDIAPQLEPGAGKTWFIILLLLLITLSLISITLIVKAIYPYLRSGNSTQDKYHSLIFFKSVAEYSSIEKFQKEYSEQTEENITADMEKQVYELAKGLKSKYNLLSIAGWFIYAEIILLLPLLILIISNLKSS
jgi:hypothetical protein